MLLDEPSQNQLLAFGQHEADCRSGLGGIRDLGGLGPEAASGRVAGNRRRADRGPQLRGSGPRIRRSRRHVQRELGTAGSERRGRAESLRPDRQRGPRDLQQEWDADPQSGGIQQAEQDFLGLDVAVNDTGIYHTGFNDTCPVIISDNGSQLTEGPFLCSIYKNAYDGEWNIQEEFRAKAANPYWQ